MNLLQAEEPPEKFLETTPATSQLSLSLRNITSLDRTLQKLEPDRPGWRFPLKTALSLVLSYAKVHQGINWEGNFSATLMDWNEKQLREDALQHLVLRVPFDNVGLMAGNFDLKPRDFIENRIHHLPGRVGNSEDLYASRRGRNILLCLKKEPLESYLKAAPLRPTLTTDPDDRLSSADILLQVNVKDFQPDDFEADMKRKLEKMFVGEPQKVTDSAFEIIKHVEQGFVAIEFRDTFRFRMQMSLNQNLPDASKAILEAWKNADSPPDTIGLPEGNLVLCLTKNSGELGRADLLKLVLNWTIRNALSNRKLTSLIQDYLTPRHETFYGVIDELWNSIQQAKSGVYLNENPDKDGTGNLLLVLKPNEPDQFRDQLASLIKFSKGTVYKSANSRAEEVTEQDIRRLIENLGADSFRDRSAATLRLKLLGGFALPQLEDATKSPDIEVAGRSRKLIDTIRKNIEDQTKNVLKEGLTGLPVPEFVLYEQQREVEGTSADLLELVWKGEQRINEEQLHKLVGPLGHEVLLVPVSDEIVLFWGSNRKLLEDSVRLLRDQKSGLSPRLKLFQQKASADRLIDIHASLQKLSQMAPEAINPKPRDMEVTDDLSSFSLEISPTHLLGDATIPYPEFRLLPRNLLY